MRFPTFPSSVGPYVSDIQRSSRRMLPYWTSAALTALMAVLFSHAFNWSEKTAFSWIETHPAWGFFILPLALIISTSLAQYISSYASGSGIPQLLAALEISRRPDSIVNKLLGFRMIVIKFIGTCICVVGGGIVGREGPLLQISAGIFYLTQKIWPRIDPKSAAPNLQSMILAGGAAGLASAFNTPLGGIIFAIEELAKVHISQVRIYVFHAVIIAGILAQAVLGNYLYFGKIQIPSPASQEIFPLILASAFIGILGALFAKLLIKLLDLRSKLGNKTKYLMTIILGLLAATVIFFFGRNAAGSGREVIVHLLSESDSTASFSLGFIRGFGNLMAYASGVSGGIFAPALSTGAALGSWLSGFGPGFSHQVWILAGMVAFLTGLSRTPFTSLILVLEMTDSHNVIISLMLASIIAQSAARLIDPISFYENMAYRIIYGKPPEKNYGIEQEPE